MRKRNSLYDGRSNVKSVFLFFIVTDFASRISRGNLFHKHGAATIIFYFCSVRNNFIFPDLGVYLRFPKCKKSPSSSIQLSAIGRFLDITYMCYEFRTPLFPAQLLQARQSDLSVTSIPQSVNWWRHNEYSCCSHPLLFVPASHTPVVKVRLVVWRSDLTGQGGNHWHMREYHE